MIPAFYPSFLGVYADDEATERTAKGFNVFFKALAPNKHGSQSVDHSGHVHVLDRRVRLQLVIRPQATPESVAQDLRILLHEADG